MLDVHSLQNFEFMNNFTLIAGNAGLYKNVTNVVILDYEGIEEDYHGFHEGDFVITNLMFAKRHPERIYNSFKALISIGVSAFAIKTVIFTKLPEEVIELANKRQIPIFLFNDIFIEDVILNITDHLRSATNFNYNENLIDEIINPADHSSQISDLIESLEIEDMDCNCSAMYLGYKKQIDKFTLQRTINKLQIQIQHLSADYNLKLALYKNGILFIGVFSEQQSKNDTAAAMEKYWISLMNYLGIVSDNFYIGISDNPLPVKKLDLTIMRCLNAYDFGKKDPVNKNKESTAISGPTNFSTYQNIGANNLFYPVLQNSYTLEYLLEIIQKLEPECTGIDAFKNTNSYVTLKACIQADFDMSEAAELLFQHQNTVRYRLKKLQSILDIPDETSFRILAMFLVQLCI